MARTNQETSRIAWAGVERGLKMLVTLVGTSAANAALARKMILPKTKKTAVALYGLPEFSPRHPNGRAVPLRLVPRAFAIRDLLSFDPRNYSLRICFLSKIVSPYIGHWSNAIRQLACT